MEEYDDDDRHEVEIVYENSPSAKGRFNRCRKHPGHRGFTPVREFTLQHLPASHRNELLLSYVRCLADLCVCLDVGCVSSGRPDLAPNGKSPYPLSKYKGRPVSSVGSGCVSWVEMCGLPAADDDGDDVDATTGVVALCDDSSDDSVHGNSPSFGPGTPREDASIEANERLVKRLKVEENTVVRDSSNVVSMTNTINEGFGSLGDRLNESAESKPQAKGNVKEFPSSFLKQNTREVSPEDNVSQNEGHLLEFDTQGETPKLASLEVEDSGAVNDETTLNKEFEDREGREQNTDNSQRVETMSKEDEGEEKSSQLAVQKSEENTKGSINNEDFGEITSQEDSVENAPLGQGGACGDEPTIEVFEEFDEEDWRPDTSGPCVCPECQRSSQPHRVWWLIDVITASHVVCDEIECAKTSIKFFYDDDNDTKDVVTITCGGVDSAAIEADKRRIWCATHDESFGLKLQKIFMNYLEVAEQVRVKYRGVTTNLSLAVTHPHGYQKHVTLGQHVEEKMTSFGWFEIPTYKHTAGTCPGSSGGRICRLGGARHFSYDTSPHSFAIDKLYNMTGRPWMFS
ncbi:uncharacterized protein LOC101861803 [Aplysia californica]|uniref:Uncharacterized protein LOC101861803 n=1 Tax=Aplysia californica TaxID=6500 RepID=A0ABM0JKW2_APLCA|nr:uncharacterized protein LOC101861803 [Aplysia californica]